MANANENEAQIDLVTAYGKYTDEVKKEMKKEAKRISKEMLNQIINSSPQRKPYQNKTARGAWYAAYTRGMSGRYKQNWKLRTKNENGGNRIVIVACNKTDAPIAHLIDLGHKMPHGGKYEGTEHIRKAQKDARAELYRAVREILK